MRPFSVRTTPPQFDRLVKKLFHAHADLRDVLREAVHLLSDDPYNLTRRHSIKKLTNVPEGEGQYRLRLGRWPVRYDVYPADKVVLLLYVGLRREDTYK